MNMLCGHRQEKVLLKGIHVLILEGAKVVLYLLLNKVPWKSHFRGEHSADKLADLSLVTLSPLITIYHPHMHLTYIFMTL